MSSVGRVVVVVYCCVRAGREGWERKEDKKKKCFGWQTNVCCFGGVCMVIFFGGVITHFS